LDNPRLLELLVSRTALESEIGTAMGPCEHQCEDVACESLDRGGSDVVVEHPAMPAKNRDLVAEALASDDCDLEASDVEADQNELGDRRDLRSESQSLSHMLTHRPLNKYCNSCRRCKAQRKPCRRGATSGYRAVPKEFGDVCTCDHIIAQDILSRGVRGEEEALVIKDLATGWIFGYPVMTKSTADVTASARDFMGPSSQIKLLHSDPAPELRAAFGELGILFEASPTGIKGNNGIAERLVRTVLDGSRTLLEHAGLPQSFWPLAMKCFSTLYNITHRLDDESTPWTRRHGVEFSGLLIPFGALVDFMPAPEVIKKLPKFAPRSIPGVFLGYELSPGGAWKGVYIVASLEDCRDLTGPSDGQYRYPHLHRTREVILEVPFTPTFPLKAWHDRTHRTIVEDADSRDARASRPVKPDGRHPSTSPDTHDSPESFTHPDASEGGGLSSSSKGSSLRHDADQGGGFRGGVLLMRA